jgi:alkylhydroperoxidase family enzyme
LTTETPNNLSKSQAYQAAAILSELKESGERKDKKEQLESVSRWRQWWTRLGPKAQAALSLTADSVSLTLPLVKLLLTGSPL